MASVLWCWFPGEGKQCGVRSLARGLPSWLAASADGWMLAFASQWIPGPDSGFIIYRTRTIARIFPVCFPAGVSVARRSWLASVGTRWGHCFCWSQSLALKFLACWDRKIRQAARRGMDLIPCKVFQFVIIFLSWLLPRHIALIRCVCGGFCRVSSCHIALRHTPLPVPSARGLVHWGGDRRHDAKWKKKVRFCYF